MARIVMERSGEMEVFVRVIREGGFSAAARSLGLTPSAISKLIARLEARLGVRLLVRTTRAVTLSSEGQIYFRAATRVLQELNDADEAIVGGDIRGRLAINSSLPFGIHVVAPAIPPFAALHRNLILDLTFTDEVVNLMAQKADIAFRVGRLPDSALVARKVGQSRRVVCAAPAYLARKGSPVSPDELRHHDCLTFNFKRSIAGWPFQVRGKVKELAVAGGLTVNNGETMRQLALAGAGVARLGLWHVRKEIERGELVTLLEKNNPGDIEVINAVYVGGGQVSRRVRAYIDYMIETVRSSPLFAGA